jgi:glycosyltransferase involved in cell wall biosynthesis
MLVIAHDPYAHDINMMSALRENGHEVTLVYWGNEGSSKFKQHCTGVFRFGFDFTGEKRKVLLFPLWILWVCLQAWKLDVDLIQPQNLPSLLPTIPAGILKGRIIVYYMTDFTADANEIVTSLPSLLSSMIGWFERASVKLTDGIILVSEGQLQYQLTTALELPHIVLYNAPEAGLVKKDRDQLQDESIFLYAGGLFQQRISGLVAAAKAITKLPDAKLVIAGTGKCRDEVESLSRLSPRISYVGPISHEEVLKLTSECACILAIYDPKFLNNAIGMPNKLFEAMAFGKPIIVAEQSMAGTTVTKHQCGISVECGSVEDTMLGIRKMMDPAARRVMGRNGRAAYDSHYSWRCQEQAYIQFIQGLRQ